ncbi:MAG: YigZ family protein [Clostridia bacterium]|nr:YigZ family protein [Clostridia bacterium]
MNSYVTLTNSTAEIVVLRSRFISYVYHIESEEEASEILTALRKKYYDATHVCYAYVADVAGNVTKSSDDGEPSSTAGAPILSVINGGGYRQVLIAVVRYFGGTKLGVGGLVKTYTDSAIAAVNASEKITYTLSEVYSAETDYNTFGKISNAVTRNGGRITDIEYSDKVRFTLAYPTPGNVLKELINLTGGKTEFINRGNRYEIYRM